MFRFNYFKEYVGDLIENLKIMGFQNADFYLRIVVVTLEIFLKYFITFAN